MTCPVVLAYLPDGRTPVYCMIQNDGHTEHVAHVRRTDGTPTASFVAAAAMLAHVGTPTPPLVPQWIEDPLSQWAVGCSTQPERSI